MTDNARWYVVHTYSGYENKVKTNLEKIIENRNLQDMILDIRVPTEEVAEQKGDTEKIVTRKVFPGYVLVKMEMTDETWYVIRNTTGVTGFVGPGSKPVPLLDEEVEKLGVDIKEVVVNYDVGDSVNVVKGPFTGQIGIVEEIDKQAKIVKVGVMIFGKKTVLELGLDQIETI